MSELNVKLSQIQDEIYDRCELAWQRAYLTVLGTSAPVDSFRARGIEGPKPVRQPWARAWVKSVDSERATVGTRDNSNSTRFENDGLVFVQVFMPSNAPAPVQKATELCEQIKKQFVGHRTPSGAFFMHELVEDDPEPEAKWVQVQFIAEWQFDNVEGSATP